MASIQIGERIRELREIQGYTREGLSEKVDISAKFLYEIEVGKKAFLQIPCVGWQRHYR